MEKPATSEIATTALMEFEMLLVKGSQAHIESKYHNRIAGLHLKELKARVSEPWPEYVRETFGIEHERADELIRLADRRTGTARKTTP
jgi:hypothetical protein